MACGFHISISSNLIKTFSEFNKEGFNCFQIFITNPMSGAITKRLMNLTPSKKKN